VCSASILEDRLGDTRGEARRYRRRGEAILEERLGTLCHAFIGFRKTGITGGEAVVVAAGGGSVSRIQDCKPPLPCCCCSWRRTRTRRRMMMMRRRRTGSECYRRRMGHWLRGRVA